MNVVRQNAASQLERQINRWASDVVRAPQASLDDLRAAAFADLLGVQVELSDATRPAQVQNLLRHAMSETISEGVINCLIVTSSSEANIQLSHIHEHIFARTPPPFRSPHVYRKKLTPENRAGDPTVAAVWRRQTFSAAVEKVAPSTTLALLEEHMPTLSRLLGAQHTDGALAVLEHAYAFSRMLHGAPSTAPGSRDAFYRSFVLELQGTLYPRHVELVKRCINTERGTTCRVGATTFPGLVKVAQATPANGAGGGGDSGADSAQTVVRRAQVICECALQAFAGPGVNGFSVYSESPAPTPGPPA